jgi:hypothetical protein
MVCEGSRKGCLPAGRAVDLVDRVDLAVPVWVAVDRRGLLTGLRDGLRIDGYYNAGVAAAEQHHTLSLNRPTAFSSPSIHFAYNSVHLGDSFSGTSTPSVYAH